MYYNFDMVQSRYFKIVTFFACMLANIVGWELIFPRIGLGKWSSQTRSKRLRGYAASYRELAIRMGGVMIKMGQFLSTRMDVLPPEITQELSGLQDEVPPEPFSHIRRVAEVEMGISLEERFENFDETVLASASIGQVHQAKIRLEPQGPLLDVVVKVQRPDIARIVDTDLGAFRVVGKWVAWYKPISKRVHIPSLMDEFSRSLYEEMDYLAEGKNAETFAENFRDVGDVRVPRVFWSHTTRRVLTMEDVLAIKITDYERIDEAGVDRREVAKRLFEIYLKQIFDDRFFHADPHPGNLFIQPGIRQEGEDKTGFTIVFVDFGMVGYIPPGTFAGLRELFIGVGLQDAARVVKAYQLLDILLPGADTGLLEKAATKIFEHFWGKTAPEMMATSPEEAQVFLSEFGDLLYELPFQVPENLILFGRCLAILSGMCSGLDHEFNVFTSLQPFTKDLLDQEGGSKVNLLYKELTTYLSMLTSLPKKTEALIKKVDQGQLEVRSTLIEKRLAQLVRSMNLLVVVLLFSVLFVSGIQLFISGYPALGITLCLMAGVIGVIGMAVNLR